jgi:hypothetical protein
MAIMTKLEELRDQLALIPGIQTSKIGIEKGMTAADYPMVRIVPTTVRHGDVIGYRQAEVLIYFGKPIEEFDEEPDDAGRVRLEKLYAELFDLEGLILEYLALVGGEYEETLLDEDRIDTYKLMAVRAVVEG